MKYLFNIILIVNFFITISDAQNPPSIHCNKLKLWTNAGSDLAHNNEGEAGITVIQTQDGLDEATPHYYSGINITSLVNDTVKGSFDFYKTKNSIPGPIHTDSTSSIKYNKIWKISKHEIVNLKRDFDDNNQIDDSLSYDILTWPGKNNPYSEVLENIKWEGRNFAPFFDRNMDGVYDPLNGDYPILDENCPEKIPSEMIWTLYHTNDTKHSFGYGAKLEVHKLIYGFQSNKDTIINSTLFTSLKIHCYETEMSDVKLSLFNDIDVFCPELNFMGTSELNNAVYGYNKLTNEGLCSLNKTKSVFTIKSLNNKLRGSMMAFPEDATRVPENLSELFNWNNNIYTDGTKLTYGGNGYNQNSTEFTNFIFPSSPSDAAGWSMSNEGLSGFDYRIYNIIDIGKLRTGDIYKVDFSFTYHEMHPDVNEINMVDTAISELPIIQAFYKNCFDTENIDPTCTTQCTWPGDTDLNGMVNNIDFLNVAVAIGKQGTERTNPLSVWSPMYSDQWNETTAEDIDYKQLDCNGNGIINTYDYNVINQNFFLKNAKNEGWGGYNDAGRDLSFATEKDEYLPNSWITANLMLNPDTSIQMAGYAFTIEYDQNLVRILSNNSIKIKLGSNGEYRSMVRREDGKIHVALFRNDGEDKMHQNLNFDSLSVIINPGINSDTSFQLKFSNYLKISQSGKFSPLTSEVKTIYIRQTLSKNNLPELSVILFPNPSDNEVQFISNIHVKHIYLIDQIGKIQKLNFENNSFSLSNFPNGVYFIKLMDDAGFAKIEKLIIQH